MLTWTSLHLHYQCLWVYAGTTVNTKAVAPCLLYLGCEIWLRPLGTLLANTLIEHSVIVLSVVSSGARGTQGTEERGTTAQLPEAGKMGLCFTQSLEHKQTQYKEWIKSVWFQVWILTSLDSQIFPKQYCFSITSEQVKCWEDGEGLEYVTDTHKRTLGGPKCWGSWHF